MLELMRRYQYSWVTILGASFIVLVMTFWGLGAGLFAQLHPIASVNGQRILPDQINRGVNQIRENIQQLYGASSAAALKGINLRQMALENIINKQLIDEEARHLGISIDDQALQEKIAADPAYQRNGQFDVQSYEEWLNDRGLVAHEYETAVRDQMIDDTVKSMIDAGVLVSDDEARHAYNLRNEKIGARYIELSYTDFTAQAAPTDQQVADYYKKNSEIFREPERVKIVYIHYDPLTLAAKYIPSDREIQDYYKSNLKSAQFTHPDQVRARHILIAVAEGASEAEKAKARSKALEVLKQAQAGGNFAKLAAAYSDDPSNKQTGGDLGTFGRGQMIKPFEDAVFAMKPGHITMVETRFGFHIVKLDESNPAHTETLAEAQPKIIQALRERAGTKAGHDAINEDLAAALGGISLQDIAKKRALEAVDTPAFAQNETIKGAEQERELVQAAFKLEPGQVRAVPAHSAPYLIKLVERQPSRIPPLKEIEVKVTRALIYQNAGIAAHAQAQKILAGIKSPADFDKAAAENKLTVKAVDPFTRAERTVPGIGQFPEVTDAAASTPSIPGIIDRVMEHEGNYYIFEVVSRTEPSEQEWKSAEKAFLEDYVGQRRAQAWTSFVNQLTRQAKIKIDTDQLGSSESSM